MVIMYLDVDRNNHFYAVPIKLNGVILAGSMHVRPSVNAYVRHEIYRKQTAGPRSANFYEHMQVDKINSPANFHPDRQRP